MTLNGKNSEIGIKDLLEFGHTIGLTESFCKASIDEIVDTVEKWMLFATQSEISEERATEIANMLNQSGIVRCI